MELIKPEDLSRFLHKSVQVGIQDKQEKENAPFIEKEIEKLQYCPDATHIRIYFNEINFIAIPVDAEVSNSEYEWTACDSQSGLNYTIRMGDSLYE